MEHQESSGRATPSPANNTEDVRTEGGEPEGLNTLRWQREESGRMSSQEVTGGLRTRTPTPTPHRVSAMPNMMAGAPNDSDSEGGEETGRARRPSRVQSETLYEGYPANTLSSSVKNQHHPMSFSVYSMRFNVHSMCFNVYAMKFNVRSMGFNVQSIYRYLFHIDQYSFNVPSS